MINDRSPGLRRSPQQHYHHHDRFFPNPNPSPTLPQGSMDWTGSGEPSPTMQFPPQFPHQQKDWGANLAPSNTGSSLSHPAASSSGSTVFVFSAPGGARGGGNRLKARASDFPSSAVAGSAAAMRDGYYRTKVVVRHLPPGLSESAFMEEIATRFSSTYNMVYFCPGKSSIKGSSFSRAYIDFKQPEYVIDFFEGFNGHLFVNERGTQYKALVEYSPNQRVANSWLKKDAKEGSIFQDPEYIKFNEQISKPIEYLSSAEIQLERKETERISGAGVKDAIIVTPLMEFVRQKRALKSAPQKSLAVSGKGNVRGGVSSMAKTVLKRGVDRSRYTPSSRAKEKATYVPRQEEAQRRDILADKKGRVVFEAKDNKILPEDSSRVGPSIQGGSAQKFNTEQGVGKGSMAGKKNSGGLDKEESINGVASVNSNSLADDRMIAPAGRVRAVAISKSHAGSLSNHQNTGLEETGPTKATRSDSGGRPGSKGHSKNPFLSQNAEQQNDRDKRFSRTQAWKTSNREGSTSELESASTQLFMEEKNDLVRQDGRRLRNKDRPDRPVWTVRQRSDVTELPKSSTVAPSVSPPGNQRQGRGSRDLDNTNVPDASKPPGKRAGSSTVYGGHEKQVWVAKPGSGS